MVAKKFLLVAALFLAFLKVHGDWGGYQGGSGYSQSRPAAVLLKDVSVLTLRRGAMTAGRRVAPVKQLHCVSGCEFEPEAVQCTAVGSDGTSQQWRCEADLPSHLRFGITEVSCEGFEYPEDPFILAGSCGLRYSLVSDNRGSGRSSSTRETSEAAPPLWRLLSWLVTSYVIFLVLRSFLCPANSPRWASSRSSFSPPPPPPPPFDGGPGGWGSGGGGWGWGGYKPPGHGAAVPSWASAAAGFGAGYLFGRQPSQRPARWAAPPTGGGQAGPSSSGGSMRRATGFASTSRR